MNNPIENLSKIFDSRIKLGIMSVLIVNHEVPFNNLKELLDITDGNLASHLKALEENKFIKMKKKALGNKTNTVYTITAAGQKAFRMHLDALEKIIGNIK